MRIAFTIIAAMTLTLPKKRKKLPPPLAADKRKLKKRAK
jgi:hypothetical protein